MERVPMTRRGYEQLKEELQYLKSVKRPQIIEAIAVARAHGDLSENAEYHAAKNEQGFMEGRIKELEHKIASANVIDPSTINAEKVVFGATVTLADGESGAEVVYQIVGIDEANLEKGSISISSPIARALIGKSEGDTATVRAPGGDREYDIVAIEYR